MTTVDITLRVMQFITRSVMSTISRVENCKKGATHICPSHLGWLVTPKRRYTGGPEPRRPPVTRETSEQDNKNHEEKPTRSATKYRRDRKQAKSSRNQGDNQE